MVLQKLWIRRQEKYEKSKKPTSEKIREVTPAKVITGKNDCVYWLERWNIINNLSFMIVLSPQYTRMKMSSITDILNSDKASGIVDYYSIDNNKFDWQSKNNPWI